MENLLEVLSVFINYVFAFSSILFLFYSSVKLINEDDVFQRYSDLGLMYASISTIVSLITSGTIIDLIVLSLSSVALYLSVYSFNIISRFSSNVFGKHLLSEAQNRYVSLRCVLLLLAGNIVRKYVFTFLMAGNLPLVYLSFALVFVLLAIIYRGF